MHFYNFSSTGLLTAIWDITMGHYHSASTHPTAVCTHGSEAQASGQGLYPTIGQQLLLQTVHLTFSRVMTIMFD